MMKEKERQAAEFEKGVEWADAHSKSITYKAIEDVAKEVINEDPQLDKLWKMIENNLRDKFIDKACEWLERALPLRPDDRDEFIEQFKEAMKGE